ncbi:hypothetical protein C1645_824091 [Glomus cerebriforme]|uniref:Protein kinase domain-containing protein n=1 Tax=Glomus cerebriforme TaxID=658196 RepID=A0A397SV51_9GLOM|nr:hypothetical protein C1645_824091 [Glomus cerebriforme]
MKQKGNYGMDSYDRFRNIQYLAQGGYSTVFKAIWLDGSIDKWDSENQQWKRNSYKLDYENAKKRKYQWKNDLKYMHSTCDNFAPTIQLFGIKLYDSQSLSALHKFNLVHSDFYSNNLLSSEHHFVHIIFLWRLRPKIVKNTDVEYAKLMKKCWHSNPNKRPTAKNLFNFFGFNLLDHFSDNIVQVQGKNNGFI